VNKASWSGIIVAIRERSSAEMVEHKRVPNLEELDEKEAYSFLTDVFFYGPVPDPEVVYQANHPVMLALLAALYPTSYFYNAAFALRPSVLRGATGGATMRL
jgi:hypothetical protein